MLAWAEWNHFVKTGDRARLARVFPPVAAYHQWLRRYRTWPDGSYWSTGWGSGMDNLPRVRDGDHLYYAHGHMTWVDATFQAVLSARVLTQMAAVLGQSAQVADLREEAERLAAFAGQDLWDGQSSYYYDRLPDGELPAVKHIGAAQVFAAGVPAAVAA